MSGEGGLEQPIRHPILWEDESYYDEEALNEELLRVFDICHGCRRCFNLCDSFPRLFDMVDDSPTGELDSVDQSRYGEVVEGCTLCDMCFLTKCPYVPPHPFNLDFPKLMLRYRAIEFKKNGAPFNIKVLTNTDQTGKIASKVSSVVNWASKEGNPVTRPLMEKTLDVDRNAALPKYCGKTLVSRFEEYKKECTLNEDAPAFGEKVVLYATCFGNYNQPQIGEAALHVLTINGVEAEVIYEGCCGMPKLEHGDLPFVANQAGKIAGKLADWIEKGYTIVPLIPSCTLMFKTEWPLLLPQDATVEKLASATMDLSEYVVNLAKTKGLAEGLNAHKAKASVHLACHARAQNVGQKAAELLRLIPDMETDVIERCSGHGGSWGIMKENFDIALKIGKPVAKRVDKEKPDYLLSECPLAGEHIVQGVEKLDSDTALKQAYHPIEIFAKAYGF